MDPLIVGLDLSLTATGVALPDGITTTLTNKMRGSARIAWIVDSIMDYLQGLDGDLVVVIEGPFVHAKHPQGMVGTFKLHGCVEDALYRAGEPMASVAPSVLKKLACGHGGAPKEQVLVAAIKRLGYEGADHNQADALWLREAGRLHYGISDVRLPQVNMDVLAKAEWPVLAAEGVF